MTAGLPASSADALPWAVAAAVVPGASGPGAPLLPLGGGATIVLALFALGATLLAAAWARPRGPRVGADSPDAGARPAWRPRALHDRVAGLLARAGLPRVPVALFAALGVVLGLASCALVLATTGVVPSAAIALAAGTAAPLLVVRARAHARRRAHRAMWPDVVDHLVSSVRSGLSLPDALEALATAGPEALREDFAGFAARYRATASFRVAVDELKERLADPTADRIVETLRLAREVGGAELSTVLRSLGRYLREEQAIRNEVEARQSWVMNAARLGVAAPWIVLLLLSTRPEAAQAYNSVEGALVILVGLVVTVVSYRVMRRIGRLRDDRRWFA